MKSFRNTLATLTLWTTLAALSPWVQAWIDEVVQETANTANVPTLETAKLEKQASNHKLKQWQSVYVLYKVKSLNGKDVWIFMQTQYDAKKMSGYEVFSYQWHDGKRFQLLVTGDITNIPATSDFSTFIVK